LSGHIKESLKILIQLSNSGEKKQPAEEKFEKLQRFENWRYLANTFFYSLGTIKPKGPKQDSQSQLGSPMPE
jgi:hypothetical protein